MDDDSTGAQSVKEGFEMYQFLKKVMLEGGFELLKWNTNSPTLRQKILEEEKKFNENFVPDDGEICNILGIPWNIITDTFLLNLCEAINDSHLDNVTKRIVLAVIACIFDPLGILAPYVITLKLLFQDVCALKCDWDAPLSDHFVKSWKRAA